MYAIAVKQVLEVYVPVAGIWVESHNGHPWNEMADRVCAVVQLYGGEFLNAVGILQMDVEVI